MPRETALKLSAATIIGLATIAGSVLASVGVAGQLYGSTSTTVQRHDVRLDALEHCVAQAVTDQAVAAEKIDQLAVDIAEIKADVKTLIKNK